MFTTDRTPRPENTKPAAAPSTPTRRFPWVRLWVDLPTDPKFRTVARLSKQPLSAVVAVFVLLLTDAANADERGTTTIPHDDIASALDLEPQQVEAILSAMQGRLLDGDRLSGWSTRQPLREDSSAERTAAYRARHGDAA